MNSIHLIGRLTAQPTIKYLENQRAVAEATLAYDDPFKKDPSTGKKKCYFFSLVFWSPKAELAYQHMVKGQKIGISGRLTQEEFIPKGQEQPVHKTRIQVETFDLLEKPFGTPSRDSTYPLQPATTPPEDGQEIPF